MAISLSLSYDDKKTKQNSNTMEYESKSVSTIHICRKRRAFKHIKVSREAQDLDKLVLVM